MEHFHSTWAPGQWEGMSHKLDRESSFSELIGLRLMAFFTIMEFLTNRNRSFWFQNCLAHVVTVSITKAQSCLTLHEVYRIISVAGNTYGKLLQYLITNAPERESFPGTVREAFLVGISCNRSMAGWPFFQIVPNSWSPTHDVKDHPCYVICCSILKTEWMQHRWANLITYYASPTKWLLLSIGGLSGTMLSVYLKHHVVFQNQYVTPICGIGRPCRFPLLWVPLH